MKSSVLVIGSQGLASLVNFVLSVVLVRVLGLDQFGYFAMYFLVSSGIVTVALALTSSPMVSLASARPDHQRDELVLTASILVTGTILILMVVAAVGFVGDLALGHASPLNMLLLFMFPGSAIAAEFVRRLLIFHGRFGRFAVFEAARLGLTLAMVALAWSTRLVETAETAIGLLFAVNVAALLLALVMCRRAVSKLRTPSGLRRAARELLGSGGWLSVSHLLYFATENVQLIIAGLILGPRAIGAVRACQSLIGLVNPLMLSLENIIPKLLGQNVARQGMPAALHRYVGLAGIFLAVFGGGLAIAALVAPFVVPLVLGPELGESVWIFQVYCLIATVNCCGSLLWYGLRAEGSTRLIFISTLLSAIVALLLCPPLMMLLQTTGLMVGLVVAHASAAMLLATRTVPRWLSQRPVHTDAFTKN